jgi:hypothetical protein
MEAQMLHTRVVTADTARSGCAPATRPARSLALPLSFMLGGAAAAAFVLLAQGPLPEDVVLASAGHRAAAGRGL